MGARNGVNAECVWRAHAMPAWVSDGLAHCEMMTTLKPVTRIVQAVADTGTRLAAPWKCSMTIMLIGDGHCSNAATSVRIASSLKSVRNCAFQ